MSDDATIYSEARELREVAGRMVDWMVAEALWLEMHTGAFGASMAESRVRDINAFLAVILEKVDEINVRYRAVKPS